MARLEDQPGPVREQQREDAGQASEQDAGARVVRAQLAREPAEPCATAGACAERPRRLRERRAVAPQRVVP